MNAERVPFEALEERSRVCFGGFRPSEACGGGTGFSPWGSTFTPEQGDIQKQVALGENRESQVDEIKMPCRGAHGS